MSLQTASRHRAHSQFRVRSHTSLMFMCIGYAIDVHRMCQCLKCRHSPLGHFWCPGGPAHSGCRPHEAGRGPFGRVGLSFESSALMGPHWTRTSVLFALFWCLRSLLAWDEVGGFVGFRAWDMTARWSLHPADRPGPRISLLMHLVYVCMYVCMHTCSVECEC